MASTEIDTIIEDEYDRIITKKVGKIDTMEKIFLVLYECMQSLRTIEAQTS